MHIGQTQLGHQHQAIEGGSEYLYTDGAVTLEPYQTHVRGIANTATDDYAVTLPPVSKCKGRVFSFKYDIANAKTVTLQDQDDSRSWTDKTIDADEDGILLYSDGEIWWVLSNAIA